MLSSVNFMGIDFGAVVWTDALSRLHPYVLHVPVGILVVLGLIEVLRLVRRKPPQRDGVLHLMIVMLLCSAPLAATSGWFLGHDGYGASIDWHRRLGIATSVLGIAIAIAYWRKARVYRGLLALGVLTMTATAHLGASETHGDNFLFEPWLAIPEETAPREPDLLPQGVDADEIPSAPEAAPVQPPSKIKSTIVPSPMAPASDAILSALRTALVHVETLDGNASQLTLDFTAAPKQPGQIAALLAPINSIVEELTLFGQKPNQDDLRAVGAVTNLRKLDLRKLDLGAQDGGLLALADLASLTALTELNVTLTPLGAGAVASLASLPNLERVYLFGTQLTQDDVADLRARRPELQIVGASVAPGEPLEVEAEVAFTKDATDEEVEAGTQPLTPENTTCPVTGKPIDPRYTIVFEGRLIGFCCPNCPKTFWQDPAKYQAALDAQ